MASSRLERIGTIFTRKQGNQRLIYNLSALLEQMEGDFITLKENEKRLQQLNLAHLKCIQQANNVNKERTQCLKEILSTFNKQVEGLIKKGAMKPDDRPLWFDVYKAFPPTDEPKFSRPKSESKPIKQIFYPEDVVRAKFHAQKLGLGTVNMLTSAGDTPTKKLLEKYDKLKAEGLSEDEIIHKCGELFENEKQQTLSKRKMDLNPKSVTAKVLAEVNIKNIFDTTSGKENEK